MPVTIPPQTHASESFSSSDQRTWARDEARRIRQAADRARRKGQPLAEADVPRIRVQISDLRDGSELCDLISELPDALLRRIVVVSPILDAPEGAEARVPCWNGAESWLAMVAADLDSEQGRETRRKHRPSRDAVLAVARADAMRADRRTGRGLATSHKTVARMLGRHVDTVRQARRVLRDLGWSVEIARGRHASRQERETAEQFGRSAPWRYASRRCLTIPERCRHLLAQLGGASGFHPYPAERSSAGISPHQGSPSSRVRAAGATKSASKNTAGKPAACPVPVGIKRLGAQLASRLPALDAGEHLDGLNRALQRVGVTADWSAEDLLRAIEHRNRDHGLVSLARPHQRNPRALFVHQVREAIQGAVAPGIARRQAQERAARQAAELRQRLAADQQLRQRHAEALAADPRPFRERWAAQIRAGATEAAGGAG